ncbi:hypothetical protein [Phenylobacterium sp.]|uniref:hypothetical protein n=1 Tax=Phenylobacterium sp. TaxID=1871053 RepID=UPI002737A950|nr:hypothetical protein [Phenylobacterium sp.]MDP3869938.1 hypothetical protein [Phenylobacterium sp.]
MATQADFDTLAADIAATLSDVQTMRCAGSRDECRARVEDHHPRASDFTQGAVAASLQARCAAAFNRSV